MTQEDKQLLLNALCGYLLYGLKSTVVKFDDNDGSEYYTDCEILGIRRNQLVEFIRLQDSKEIGRSEWYDISWFKPYLRPMSSMTEEEQKVFSDIESEFLETLVKKVQQIKDDNERRHLLQKAVAKRTSEMVQFYNKSHFDYNGLIEKGLALEAPEGMYKID